MSALGMSSASAGLMCIFCGGDTPATTEEHCPPRALFQKKQWPEGHVFPACSECNNGSSDEDLLVAMLARMDPFTESGDKDGRQTGYMKLVNKQFPGLFRKMMPTAVEARQMNRRIGIKPEMGQTHQDVSPFKIPDELNHAVRTFAKKLSKAVYYSHAGTIFPKNGAMALYWFSNAELMMDGKYTAFEDLSELSGVVPKIERTRANLADQFQYKFSLSEDLSVFVLQTMLGKAFGFVVFGSTIPGHMLQTVESLRKRTGVPGPFALIDPA